MITGQIGLLRNADDFIGKAIEWATDSTTHHVVVAVSETHCVSGEQIFAKLHPVDHWEGIEWSQFDLSDAQREAIVGSALSMVGRPYNTSALVLMLLSRLTRVPIPQFAIDWLKRRPHVDCSQLADIALQAGGIDLFEHDSVLVTPADFERYCHSQDWL